MIESDRISLSEGWILDKKDIYVCFSIIISQMKNEGT